jgi:hypothetical protein
MTTISVRSAPTGTQAAWAPLTWTMLLYCGAHFVVNGVVAALLSAHRSVIGDALVDEADALARLAPLETALDVVALLAIGLTLTGLAVAVAWVTVTRRLARRHGERARTVLRHPALAVVALLVLVSVLLSTPWAPPVPDSADAARAVDLTQIVIAGSRMVIAALLAVAAWAVRGRVRAMLARRQGLV